VNVKSYARIGAAIGTAALGLGLLASPASADPATGTYRIVAGTGSDTTQDVVNGLGNVVDSGATIASYNATGTATVKTRATGCVINRPNGSSAGIDALRTAVDTASGCLDFARSSRTPADTTTTDLTWVPFAKDAVTYAYRSGSGLPTNLTTAQLKSVYECTLTSLNGVALTPLLPQASSGTRAFFLSSIGVTTPGVCVTSGSQENDGTVLDTAGDIAPYSVAQYFAQGQAIAGVPNRRGSALLGSVNGQAPRLANNTLNPNFPYNRDVYNVVPTNKLTVAPISTTFVGSASKVCNAMTTASITRYGFGTLGTACGATTLKGER
jgi:ABC-type phosphate transport system substrate-binding protein